jgi:hypothetical protein
MFICEQIWMNLEEIVLNVVRQAQKDKFYVILLTQGNQTKVDLI